MHVPALEVDRGQVAERQLVDPPLVLRLGPQVPRQVAQHERVAGRRELHDRVGVARREVSAARARRGREISITSVPASSSKPGPSGPAGDVVIQRRAHRPLGVRGLSVVQVDEDEAGAIALVPLEQQRGAVGAQHGLFEERRRLFPHDERVRAPGVRERRVDVGGVAHVGRERLLGVARVDRIVFVEIDVAAAQGAQEQERNEEQDGASQRVREGGSHGDLQPWVMDGFSFLPSANLQQRCHVWRRICRAPLSRGRAGPVRRG